MASAVAQEESVYEPSLRRDSGTTVASRRTSAIADPWSAAAMSARLGGVSQPSPSPPGYTPTFLFPTPPSAAEATSSAVSGQFPARGTAFPVPPVPQAGPSPDHRVGPRSSPNNAGLTRPMQQSVVTTDRLGRSP